MDWLRRFRAWTRKNPIGGAMTVFLGTMISFCLFNLLFDTADFLDRFWRDILIALPMAAGCGIFAYFRVKQLARASKTDEV